MEIIHDLKKVLGVAECRISGLVWYIISFLKSKLVVEGCCIWIASFKLQISTNVMVFCSYRTDTSNRLVNALLLKPFNLAIWYWLTGESAFCFKKDGNANKKIQPIQPSPASEIKEKCYFCMRMVSRKINADKPRPPSAQWYLFCKFHFYSVLVWQSHSFHQQVLLTIKEINYKDVYKLNQKNIFLHNNCLFIEESYIHD